MALSLFRIFLAIFFLASGALGAFVKSDRAQLASGYYTDYLNTFDPWWAEKQEFVRFLHRGWDGIGAMMVISYDEDRKRFLISIRIDVPVITNYINDQTQKRNNANIDGLLIEFAFFTSKTNGDGAPWKVVRPVGTLKNPNISGAGYGAKIWRKSKPSDDEGLFYDGLSITRVGDFYRAYYKTTFIDKNGNVLHVS